MNKVNPNKLINWWLQNFHNTSIEALFSCYPDYLEDNRAFYEDYSVTQEQHDQWEDWAKEYTIKITGVSKGLFNRSWGLLYLNVSPQIKRDDKENS